MAAARFRTLLAKIEPVALRVGLGLASIALLHAVVVTLLLWTGGLGWLLARSAGGVDVRAGHSFSLWPGVVHLRQLHLDVTDSNVHLALHVPSGRVNISLGELLRRRFVTTRLTGDGFVLRIKPRLEALPEERRAALPPLSDPERPSGPKKEPGYRWPIRIGGVSAGFDELWISELRYVGRAQVRGGFELAPGRHLTVDPSEVSLRGGSLRYGEEQQVLEVQQLAIHASLPETAVNELRHGWREGLAARLEVAGRVVDLGFAGSLLPQLGTLSGGRGDVSFRAGAEHGRWVGDFVLDYASEQLSYAQAGLRGSASIVLAARSTAPEQGDGAAPLLPLELRLGGLTIEHEQRELSSLEEARLVLQLTREFPFALPRSGEIELRDLRLAQLEQLPEALSPAGWAPRSGRVPRARAELDWREGGYKGGARLTFADLRWSAGDWAIRQSGQLALEGLRWPGPGYKVRLSSLSLELDPLSLRHPPTTIDAWRLRLELEDVGLALLEKRLEASFRAGGDDARPVLTLLGVQQLPPGAAEFLAMEDLRVLGQVALAPRQQELIVERAQSDTIDVRGRYVRRGSSERAALLFKAAPLSLGVAVRPGDTKVEPFADDAWLDARLGALKRALDEPARAAALR